MSAVAMNSIVLPASGSLESLSSIPAGVIIAMVVLGVLELALDVVALVLLVRTPRERVTMPKWAWALLIIFINLIGSILFLAIGRRPAAAVDPLTTGAQTGDAAARPSSASVADALYGSAPGTGGAEPGSTTSNGDDGNAP